MQRILKILLLSSTLEGGGAESRPIYLLRYMNRKVFEPILCLKEKRGAYLKDIPQHTKSYILKKRYNLTALINMCKVILKEDPDIIFGINWGINMIAIIALQMLFFKRRVKMIIGIGTNPNYYEHQFIMRFLYRNFANLIVANSHGIRRCLISSWKIPEEKVYVIHNGIDIEHIDKLSLEKAYHAWMNKNLNLIISVGNLRQPKGFPYLLDALKIVNKKKTVYLIIIGKGKEEKRLKEMAKDMGINERVDFLGFKKNPFKYIANVDLFVLSSLWEGFPNVLLEAMACQTPVISTDAPYGPAEIIEDNINGYLVPAADSARLAEKILYVLENLDKQDDIIREARQKIEKNFSVHKMVKNYEKLFHSIYTDNVSSTL